MKANKTDKKKLEERLTAEPKESKVSYWFLFFSLLGVLRGLLSLQQRNYKLGYFITGVSIAAIIYFVYKKIRKE